MTFIYTDKQLNELNFGKNVYSVNIDYVKRENIEGNTFVHIVAKPDDELLPHETNVIVTEDDQQFQVIKTYSDPVTGFDGMAVATVVKGGRL